MTSRLVRYLSIAILGCGFASIVIGHPDDPKVKDRKPRYEGSGWTGSSRGEVPLDFPAVGVKLESWLSLPDFGDHSAANDCWGYTSGTGREYAIIGLSGGTAFVEVTEPSNPQIVAQFPGPGSIWRDVKTYQDYAYVVSEGGGGIQVFDLSNIDAASERITQLASVTTGGALPSHNVVIDTDSGFLYRCGGSGNGLRIYDLAQPDAPEFVAAWPDRYVHDAQVRTMNVPGHPDNPRQIAFCCSGFNNGWDQPGIDILDVTDKAAIELLARYEYPNAVYSHQAWLSEDSQYLFLNDELDEGTFGIESKLIVIDVSDLTSPSVVDPISNGDPAITHNLYARDGMLFASNYTGGLRIFDLANPASPAEVAWFDTVPESAAATFNGLWSNYPFFPSGTVIGSDIEKGLFVWSLEVNTLEITITGEQPERLSPAGQTVAFDVTGLNATLAPGSVRLMYDAGDGFIDSPAVSRGGASFDAEIPAQPCGTVVRWYIEAQTSDAAIVTLPQRGEHDPFVGFVGLALPTLVADDFETDAGWTATLDGATSGDWERGVPVNDPSWVHGPATDGDGSGSAWLTDNRAGNSDVDNGAVVLTSPVWDFADQQLIISYDYYLRLSADNGIDHLRVEASANGVDGPWTEIARHQLNGGPNWRRHTIAPDMLADAGFVPSATTSLRFTANDDGDQGVVEAGIDGLMIRTIECTIALPGDTNADGAVDLTDLLNVISGWGTCEVPCPPCIADLDGNCEVDLADLLAVISNWGSGG